MRESKLIQLVLRLDKAEIKAFDKFLQSPYFNTNDTLITFWAYIKAYAPDFTFLKPKKNKIFADLPVGKNRDDAKLNQLRFQLLKLLEEFLAIDKFKKSDFAYQKQIADVYLEKEIKEEFEKRYRKLLKTFGSEDFLTRTEVFQKMSLYHELYFNVFKVKGDKYSTELDKCTQLLELYYTRQKLLYTVEWISISSLYNYKKPENIKRFIAYLQQREQELPLNPIQFIFENVIRLLISDDVEITTPIFTKIKQTLSENYDNINKIEKITIIRVLINYCIKASRKGKNLTQAVFELYQLGLRDGIIFQKGIMTNASFFNIVGTAIKLKKFDWGVEFINKESYRLYEPQSNIYRSIAEASLYFYKGEHKNCLMLLSNTGAVNHTTMEISKRGLLLRAAFECYLKDKNYAPIVAANIENFNKFLSRKEMVTDSRKIAFANFVRFIKRLVRKYEKGLNTKDIEALKDYLLGQKVFPIEYKQWLLNHLEVFIKMELQKATS